MTDIAHRHTDRRWLLLGSVAVACVVGAAVVGKYQLVEPVPFAAACEQHEGPAAACLMRGVLVALFVQNFKGIALAALASLLFGLWATVTRMKTLAFAAVAMGGVSIVLYRFDYAVVGVMLGLLVLARAAVAGPQQHTGADQAQAGKA
jgi:O-antigen ligase